MKAIAYSTAHEISEFQLKETEVPRPTPGEYDILVRVHAISVNPVDFKIRQSRSNQERPVVLGWDAAGEILEVGKQVQELKAGDRVFYAGDITRDGCYAEFQTVDARIAAKIPDNVTYTDAAALPLTALTAWEVFFESMRVQDQPKRPVVLIVGGAGGVGSIAIQLLKKKTDAMVIATASRPETIQWCKDMGADHVLNHKDLPEQLKAVGFDTVDCVFTTAGSEKMVSVIGEIVRPFGSWGLIDDPATLNIAPLKLKSISVHWELMFTKSLMGYDLESQGRILSEVAALFGQGLIRTTAKRHLKGLKPETLREAHELLESGASIGKIVIEV